MFYFYAAPPQYKKILFVLQDLRRGNGESLANYYLRTYEHLVPVGVEFWEYSEKTGIAQRVLANKADPNPVACDPLLSALSFNRI